MKLTPAERYEIVIRDIRKSPDCAPRVFRRFRPDEIDDALDTAESLSAFTDRNFVIIIRAVHKPEVDSEGRPFARVVNLAMYTPEMPGYRMSMPTKPKGQ